MKSGQRAFIHSLAEDFGLDGESVDPEPHRHVVLFKTPKFVSAPMKTLAQAARIRRIQGTVPATMIADKDGSALRRADEAHPPFNGCLLLGPRFALTIDEISGHIQSVSSEMHFDVRFLSQRDAVALLPAASTTAKQLEQQLIRLRSGLETEIKKHRLAESVLLCAFDPNPTSRSDPEILYEQDPALAALPSAGTTSSAGGWSQVAAKGSANPKRLAPLQKSVGEKPVYTVLGSKLAEHKRRKEEEERIEKERKEVEAKLAKQSIGDNWEDEMNEDEDEDEGQEQLNPEAAPQTLEEMDGPSAKEDLAPASGISTPAA